MNSVEFSINEPTTIEEALQLFDQLPPADLEFMKGLWKGWEIQTGHPMNGLLDLTGWYGKLFISEEEVHPLLFYASNKKSLYSVNPKWIPLHMAFPKIKILRVFMLLLSPFLQTRYPKARMRMIAYRNKVTACMVYDHKAIIDAFVKIDDDTVLGIMDLKGDSQPYVFAMKREETPIDLQFKRR